MKKKDNFFLLILILFFVGATAQIKTNKPYVVNLDLQATAQTIDNIGASGCWFSEGIGKYWPEKKRNKIAELLFSKQLDNHGQPVGIGLSSWRFNIGAGTFEQGDSSGIQDFRKRTECFLNTDGSYDWTKQQGYQFFLTKARDYGVEDLIAFSNSPPVQFTQNGLGFKTEKDFKSNLKTDAYDAYAAFLTNVIRHFDQTGIHFKYVSPVNEPQWDWSYQNKKADQEGSSWRNEEIYKIALSLDKKIDEANLNTKILVTEAGMLTYLYGGKGQTSRQIPVFFDGKSPFYIGRLSHVPPIIGGHSYFTESNDSTLIAIRKQLADSAKSYRINYWQTEYSMLGDGYKEGKKDKIPAIDCALFLASVIHTDLSVGNAKAWQFWNAYEPGTPDFDTRYYLIALNAQPDFKDGTFKATKNLWALGNFSRFIRPGMQRLIYKADGLKDILLSAYSDKKGKVVIVGINKGQSDIEIKLSIKNSPKSYRSVSQYLTNGEENVNMKPLPKQGFAKVVILPAKSISTIVVN